MDVEDGIESIEVVDEMADKKSGESIMEEEVIEEGKMLEMEFNAHLQG